MRRFTVRSSHWKGCICVIWVLLLSACSSTTISGVWKNPDYRGGGLNRVLVVSIAKMELLRHLYEDKFVAQLQAQGIEAAPGYRVLPADAGNELASLQGVLGQTGYHFLLISRLVDQKTVEIVHPGTTRIEHFPSSRYYYHRYPYYQHWRDYYRSSYAIIETTPPYISLNELVILETNVYDSSDEIIFSVQTETLIDYGAEETIQDIVSSVIKALEAHDLI